MVYGLLYYFLYLTNARCTKDTRSILKNLFATHGASGSWAATKLPLALLTYYW